jgi:chemotaxis protein methyltransferase CheR
VSAEIETIRRWVEDELGLRPSSERALEAVERLLRRRGRAAGLADPLEMRRTVTDDGELREALVRILTSSHTLFFRDLRQLESIVESIARRVAQHGRPAKVWSAGCSTGEEPYSLAGLCLDAGVPVEILATDISAPSLELARSARYPRLTAKRAPAELGGRHLLFDAEGVRVRPEVTRIVEFGRHDLVQDAAAPPRGGGFDVILCRNVLIYYRPEVARLVLEALGAALAPGGMLFIAPTDELTCRLPEALEPTAAVEAFRRSGDGEVPSQRPKPTPVRAFSDAPIHERPEDYGAAVQRMREGDHPGARVALGRILEQTPDHFDALLSLAAVQIELREFAGVQELVHRALALEDLSPEPTLLEALMLRKQSRFREALVPLRRSAFLDPRFWPASFLLATTWERLGDRSRSRSEFSHALQALARHEEGAPQRHVEGLGGLYIDPMMAAALCRARLGP